uniref:Endonuclease/exonuclease/phosphatase domain-containing protein n=1 Tax=Panagrolaimus sp. ES5 TaxID=591445 RepID=A0AC34GN47_9BILA
MKRYNHDPKYIVKRIRKRNSVAANNTSESPSPSKIRIPQNTTGLIEPSESSCDFGFSNVPQSSNTVAHDSNFTSTETSVLKDSDLLKTKIVEDKFILEDNGEDGDIVCLTQTKPKSIPESTVTQPPPDVDVIVIESDSEEDSDSDLSELSKLAINVPENASSNDKEEDTSVETIVQFTPKTTVIVQNSFDENILIHTIDEASSDSTESVTVITSASVNVSTLPDSVESVTEVATTSLIVPHVSSNTESAVIDPQSTSDIENVPVGFIQVNDAATTSVQNAPLIKEYNGIERTVTHYDKSKGYIAKMELEDYQDSLSFYVAQQAIAEDKQQESLRGPEVIDKLTETGIDADKTFTVLSYNVLCHVKIKKYPRQYPRKSILPKVFQWNYRKQLLKLELHNFNADICCLQEVERDKVEEFYDPLMVKKKGYEAFYAWRENNELDGCAIFWNSKKFYKIQEITVSLFYGVQYLDKPNVAQILRLKHIKTGKELIVVNTQLVTDPKLGAEKLNQLAVIFAHLHKVRTNNQPIIFCGDFALKSPASLLYKFITDAEIDCAKDLCSVASLDGNGRYCTKKRIESLPISGASKIQNNCTFVNDGETPCSNCKTLRHSFNFESVYGRKTSQGSNVFTTFHQKNDDDFEIIDGNPDFIFYSVKQKIFVNRTQKEIVESDLFLHKRLSLPEKDNIEDLIKLTPHRFTCSDHLPLFAEFFLP